MHPGLYCREAGVDVGEGWVVGGVGAEVDLGVVGIAVEVQVEVAEDLTKGENVDDEKEGTEYRALGNTLCDRGCGRGAVIEGDEMRSVGEV